MQCLAHKLRCDCHSRAEPVPVKMGTGVQFKDAWIPACAGMTYSKHASVLKNILGYAVICKEQVELVVGSRRLEIILFRGWKPLPQRLFYSRLDFLDKRLRHLSEAQQ